MAAAIRCLVAMAVLAMPVISQAHEEYPPEIQRHLAGRDAPPCSVCHLGGKTAGATVVTLFGLAMRARGLSGRQTLDPALDAMARDQVDSDGDGQNDIQELIAGTNPNEPGQATGIQDPQLGCVVAGRSPPAACLAAIGLALAALIRRRRSRLISRPPSRS